MAQLWKPGSNRALAQPYVQAAATRGLTSAATTELLRGAGISYRRQDLLDDMRYYTGAARQVDALRSVRRDFTPSARTMAVWRGAQKSAYRYQVSGVVTFGDGSYEERTLTFESSRPLSSRALADQYGRKVLDEYDARSREAEVDEIVTVGAWRR